MKYNLTTIKILTIDDCYDGILMSGLCQIENQFLYYKNVDDNTYNFYKVSEIQLNKLMTIQKQWKAYIKNLKSISDISKWNVTELRNIKKEIVSNNYFTARMNDIKDTYDFGFIPIDLTAKIHCENS